ncbi:class I SAM-dependent methyltransferase [Rhodococcus sp. BP-252]|uniref:class I SAM-dependent methyltransferase n=1 Tax=unclassified Rhodococcus (in: high G+C Gram-positive bacteria) TaxID=192944 RepID=UPI001430B8DC|nr:MULTISPECIES: class I SAM-dependent methyltransferase [unclassified Rhodococcus (in: high G+C Gram-positive bacteria)]NIL77085.1 Ubiquinone/menaquinone biosynthesis C-methyltransferase UbiE [Rhodococcus sp. B10]MBY6411112.1 class I SAM-dependent methyltransferase [Rhodococcus sp. BP-320]MBY6415771.1 class I SAM-dependent methyltransferase [Rhodococcus sp. BP-321]MBY6420847.1 class I SAM-dependent methyltransferase [Rhodococcus sp. BP-324]MBY6425902.1 class I SAM-dependent methyltransferase 
MSSPRIIPSPNIWHWPRVYEAENRAQDIDGRIPAALKRIAPWEGATVVDVGCGSGFHLPEFAATAARVVGVEPHAPLVRAARARTASLDNVEIVDGNAESLPLDDASADVVHARTAYFFGAGCGPGITEAMRVLRPGGILVVVDLDVSASPYGDWMRADLPKYDCAAVEAFFDAEGFSLERVDTRWQFDSRQTMRAVLGIEFTERTAARAARSIPGLGFDVRYRIHWRRRPAGLVT